MNNIPTSGPFDAFAADQRQFALNMQGDLARRSSALTMSPQSMSQSAGSAVHIQPAPEMSITPAQQQQRLCAGLDYANMKKEEARDEYKERRRRELLEQGEIDRVKRRKKNDTSMSDNQKYHRRLKMNQDSAAAARHAQDVYVQTLEELVATAEAEKLTLSMEANNLRTERDELARRLNELQSDIAAVLPLGESNQHDADCVKGPCPSSYVEDAQLGFGDQQNSASSVLMLRKMMELLGAPETPSALQSENDFARGLFGIMPAPAV